MQTSGEREAAYAHIAAVRSAWAGYKQRVIDGDLSYDEIFAIAEQDPVLATMKLLPLIESIPEVGKVRSRRALDACGIGEAVTVADVEGDARVALRSALELGGG